jgi:squalene-hopene/tetraprenyl-beta-curcumene cyclase
MSLKLLSPQLQFSVAQAATVLATLQSRWPGSEQLTIVTESGYYYLPYLFFQAFPGLTTARLEPIYLSGRMLASSILLHDKLIDRQPSWEATVNGTIQIMAMQFEAYQLLYQYFPANSKYWERFRSYLTAYVDACIQEKSFVIGNRAWSQYDAALSHHLTISKNGLAKIIIAGLVELAQDDSRFNVLTDMIDHYNLAFQAWDDLQDWKEDLATGTPSLLLSRILTEKPVSLDSESLTKLTKTLAQEIYYGGHAIALLNDALMMLTRAEVLRSEIPDLGWYNLTDSHRHNCQSLLTDIENIVRRNIQRAKEQPQINVTLPIAATTNQQLVHSSLQFLLDQWRQGFGAAKDIARYPKNVGLNLTKDYYSGDIFQRAIIADVLCDADLEVSGQLQPIIQYEADYLLKNQATDGIKGWRYFPELMDLPPDTDDLAQVMQVLWRAGRQADITDACEPVLQLLLRENAHADGSLETWIVPTTRRTPQQERHAELVAKLWGSGGDPEVVANLVYALFLYDFQRFSDVIARANQYIEAHQSSEGYWKTRWYLEPYYGIYACLRALCATNAESLSIKRAAEFLRRAQNADGGWGKEAQSDPLSTALALLALSFIPSAQGLPYQQEHQQHQQDVQNEIVSAGATMVSAQSESDLARATHALAYLQNCQQADNSWASCQFIYVGFGEFRGSRTLTTAFVLKATLAWERIMAIPTPSPAITVEQKVVAPVSVSAPLLVSVD